MIVFLEENVVFHDSLSAHHLNGGMHNLCEKQQNFLLIFTLFELVFNKCIIISINLFATLRLTAFVAKKSLLQIPIANDHFFKNHQRRNSFLQNC